MKLKCCYRCTDHFTHVNNTEADFHNKPSEDGGNKMANKMATYKDDDSKAMKGTVRGERTNR